MMEGVTSIRPSGSFGRIRRGSLAMTISLLASTSVSKISNLPDLHLRFPGHEIIKIIITRVFSQRHLSHA